MLRPRWASVLNWAVLATLFVPAVVLLIPLYKIIVAPADRADSLINNFFAVWLPAGASAFNVVLVARFFDSLPREIFEAARVDGAGPFRLFWSHRAAHEQADHRRRVRVRGDRVVEGLPLALPGAQGPTR